MADFPNGLHLRRSDIAKPISILDFGCGVGYGSAILATIPNSFVLGIDMSSETIEYASQHYKKPNIEYKVCDIHDFVGDMKEWDYIVAYEIVEHISDGFDILPRLRIRKRLIASTPYNEPPGSNKHHCLFNVTEDSYTGIPRKEFFYGDIEGHIYAVEHKPKLPYTLLCVITREHVARLRTLRLTQLSLLGKYWCLIRKVYRKIVSSTLFVYRNLCFICHRLRHGKW